MVLLPLCFQEQVSFLLRGKQHLGIPFKLQSETYQGMKITSTGQEAGKSKCGAEVKMQNIAILIKITVRCSYCSVPGTELPVSRRLEKQITSPQQLQKSNQICKESYNGSYPLHLQVTAVYTHWRAEKNWVLLILSGRFSFFAKRKICAGIYGSETKGFTFNPSQACH